MPEVVNYTAWRFWLDVCQLVGYLALAAYVFLTNRHKATNKRINDLEKDNAKKHAAIEDKISASQAAASERCAKHHERTTTLEVNAKNAPTHADLGAVYDRINMVKGAVDEMVGAVKGLSAQVQLLVKYHMGEGK